jgi:hypothetical protein
MLLWPVMAPLGFLLLAALIITLGASSTAKYEFERNRVQAQRERETVGAGGAGGPAARPSGGHPRSGGEATEGTRPEQGTAVGVASHPASHPAGRQLADPASGTAWWLVDESADQPGDYVVAGPFADRIDADWAALSGGLSATVRSVHGVQRGDGGLVRRQRPQERAWLKDLGEQLDRLPEDWNDLLSDDDALTTLVVEVAAALVEAGVPLHDCAGEDPAGGVCLTPGPRYGGVVVSWHQHDRMSVQRVRGAAMEAVVQRTMNAAIADLLAGMGFEVEPFGSAGCCLVTDIHNRG